MRLLCRRMLEDFDPNINYGPDPFDEDREDRFQIEQKVNHPYEDGTLIILIVSEK